MHNSKTLSRKLTTGFLTLILVLSGIMLPNGVAKAADASSFNPGLIISDSLFFSGNSMSASEVQNFLNTKVPSCTINNGQASHAAGAAFGSTVISQFCLKDYAQATPSMAAQPGTCAAYAGSSRETAASIISRVGQACNVSPKVLLVLLEKEQSLVTDSWPTERQINQATGFACYDNGQPCVQDYAGFFYQVWSAARQFQRYGTSPFTWYPVGQTTNILFQANRPDCGSSPVYIQNRATAALYYYTPYQPNAAALSNLYGTGDGCSAYGNRNFWRMYTDWFGSTTEIPGSRKFTTALYVDVLGRIPSDAELNYWLNWQAAGGSRYDIGSFFVNSDEFRTLKITEAYQIAFSRSPDAGGALFWLNQMRSGAIKPDDLLRIFLTTTEMYSVQGGGTNAGYFTKLYQKVLGREPDAGGLSFWVQLLDAGKLSIYSAADAIWSSPEKMTLIVQTEFQRLLGRSSSGGELEFWKGFAGKYGVTMLRAALISTAEYAGRADTRF